MYKYEVALSFASEIESIVREVAEFIQAAGHSVFFFPEQQRDMISENVLRKTYQIFQKESFIKVLFITEAYKTSRWTQLEKRCALSSTKNQCKRLIIVNFLGEQIEADLKELIYIDGNKKETDEIAAIIDARITELGQEETGGKTKEKKIMTEIRTNYGIVAGDNAIFQNIKFN